MKHTPAPWAVSYEASPAICVHGSDHQRLAEIWLRGDIEKEEANARLIAAAPEMVEALKDILSGWKYIRQVHGDLYGVGWDRAQEKAESAIAKATGEAL